MIAISATINDPLTGVSARDAIAYNEPKMRQNEFSSINSMLGGLSQIVGKNCQLISFLMAIKGRSNSGKHQHCNHLCGASFMGIEWTVGANINGSFWLQWPSMARAGKRWPSYKFSCSKYVFDMRYQWSSREKIYGYWNAASREALSLLAPRK